MIIRKPGRPADEPIAKRNKQYCLGIGGGGKSSCPTNRPPSRVFQVLKAFLPPFSPQEAPLLLHPSSSLLHPSSSILPPSSFIIRHSSFVIPPPASSLKSQASPPSDPSYPSHSSHSSPPQHSALSTLLSVLSLTRHLNALRKPEMRHPHPHFPRPSAREQTPQQTCSPQTAEA